MIDEVASLVSPATPSSASIVRTAATATATVIRRAATSTGCVVCWTRFAFRLSVWEVCFHAFIGGLSLMGWLGWSSWEGGGEKSSHRRWLQEQLE